MSANIYDRANLIIQGSGITLGAITITSLTGIVQLVFLCLSTIAVGASLVWTILKIVDRFKKRKV